MLVLDIILESAKLAIVICLAIYLYLRWSQMPPGPLGLPYVGYYPFLSEDASLHLLQLTKKYGKVFCFRVTGQMYAHISDLQTIREVAVTKADCFEKRPGYFNLFQEIFGGGVIYLNGERWKVLRNFFILKFKEFGMGKETQDGVMHDCLEKIVITLNESGGNKFEALGFFSEIANNVIRNIVFGGAKLDENDIQQFNEAYLYATEFSNRTNLLLCGPVLKYILMPFVLEYRNCRRNTKQMDALMAKFIQQHEKEFDRNNIRNVVDAYINERKLLEEKKDPKAKFFTERCLVSSMIQFFGDGTMGVAGLTVTLLSTLSSHPDIQKAIQSEVDEVVGRNRLPSADDKSKLSYTSAVIYEGLRMTKLPLLPTLECTKETVLEGCRIPRGTIALYNLWAALRDPETYDEPNKFDPTRFLSVDGKKPRCETPSIFGVGKRSCVGESLVNMQLLLYIATVFQHFDLHPVKEQESQSEELNVFIKATPRAP